ncbi:MAG: helix-turn-helix transcriptional regulator [Hoeflea sp.]|nr:helix-turn-helix transcriptional regulator [Hoeflea sp.]
MLANYRAMSQRFATALRATLKERKISNEKIAEMIGAHPVTVSKLLNGRMKFTEEWMEKFGQALGMSTGQIIATGGEAIQPPANPNHRTPVYGLAAASIRGNLTMTNDPVEWVKSPPAIETVRDAYAVIVTGSSMEPRYHAGDIIFVNPHRPPRAGDHVIIQEAMNGGTSVSIKRYERQTETHIITTQYNPLAEVKFSRAQITAVHRVLTNNELIGV